MTIKKPWFFLLLFLVSLISTLTQSCDNKRRVIHLILPENWRGAFVIQTNKDDGVKVEENDGYFTYTIPSSGLLPINGKGPFFRWHTLRASFSDGKSISIGSRGARFDDTIIAIWPAGNSATGNITYFLGTSNEAEDFFKNSATSDPPIGDVLKQKLENDK